uniref:Non-lysosomal glucosylceramidase n=1 Tax=Stylophora pistillata TaxID=50429 RepID=A0A2B4S094_STYPI
MKVGNPFIPTDLKNTGIPAVFYEFEIENTAQKTTEISLLAAQQNAVGFTKVKKVFQGKSFKARFKAGAKRVLAVGNRSKMYVGNYNSVVDEFGGKTLYMEGPYKKTDAHFGQMALMTLPTEAVKINSTALWKNIPALAKTFLKKGTLKSIAATGKSKKGQTYSGATTVSMTLKPGEKKTIHMVLVWYFPNGKNGGHLDRWDGWGKGKWEGKGNRYANYWKDIKDLTRYIYKNHKGLLEKTKLFTDTYYKTNFPHWLTERLANQLSIIKSRTIFHDKNNYIGLWEGAGAGDGSCAGNCNHVWHYAQAHARLFPTLGRIIREQSFGGIKKTGALPYRQPKGSFAFDGQLGEILSAYREHLLTENNEWLTTQYPAIKKALNYVINTYDKDKDGWLNSAPKHTTYDASMSGNPSFLTSLYLAALRAGEKMATLTDDEKQAKAWKKIADKSAKVQANRLFNGRYFIQIPGGHPATDYDTGCQSDQILGQWWAYQVGLGDLYPRYQIESATSHILKYNFKANLKRHNQGGRIFGLPQEAGFVGTTWEAGTRPKTASGYSDEIWTTYEYTIGSGLLRQGLIRDALTILKAGYDRYDGTLKTDYPSKSGWGNFGFSGNPFGDDECGQFYARALSQWSVLLAAQGFSYDGPKNEIGSKTAL